MNPIRSGLRLTLILIFASVILSGCFSSAGKWSAYSMSIQINAADGSPLQNATVRSIGGQEQLTNEDGMATLYFRTKGLYVITISAADTETTQIKVNVPADTENVVVVQMPSKSPNS